MRPTSEPGRTRGLGHVFQQRFWSGPIGDAAHYFAVLRYVEANARRAYIVNRAEEWQWGSLHARRDGDLSIVDSSPYDLPDDWPTLVNRPQFERELALARYTPRRGRPCTFQQA